MNPPVQTTTSTPGQQDDAQYTVPNPITPVPAAQGAPLTANPGGATPDSVQTTQPQVTQPVGQPRAPQPADSWTPPAPSQQQQDPHTTRLLDRARAVMQALTPGPLYTTKYNDDGTVTRTAQPVSAKALGISLALEAISGSLAGAGARGTNSVGQAAQAGLQKGEQIAHQNEQAQEQLDQQAKDDLQTRFTTLKNNLTLLSQARSLAKTDEQDHIDAEATAAPLYDAAKKEGAIVADNLEDADAMDVKKYPITDFDRYITGHHIATDGNGNPLYMIPGSGRIVPKDTPGAIPKYVNTWAIADRHKFTLGDDGQNLPFWDSQIARGGIQTNDPTGKILGKITSVQAQSLQVRDAMTNAAMADINRARATQGQPELNLDAKMKTNGTLQDALGLFTTQLGVNGHNYTNALQAVYAKYPEAAAMISTSYGGTDALQKLDQETARHDRENGFRVNGFKNEDEAEQAFSNPSSTADVRVQAKNFLDAKRAQVLATERDKENITVGGEERVAQFKNNFSANPSSNPFSTETPVSGVRANYLASLPNADQVRQIGEGRQFSTRMFDGKEGKALAAQVATAYPDYDISKAASYYKTRNDFDSGKEGRQTNALNTALGHLKYANDALSKVGAFGTLPGVSNVERAFGSQNANSLDVARKVMLEEVHNAWGVGAFTVDDRKSWENTINTASPRELKQKMVALTQLLGTKMQNLQEQYDGSVPSSAVAPKQLLHDSSREAYKSVTGEDVPDVLQPRQSYAPQKATQSQPSANQPQLTSIKVNPQTGQRIGWNGSAWVDARTGQAIGGR